MRFGVCVRALDALLGSLRGCLERFPDKRRGLNTTYPMGDIRMAAFSVFFMQSPSFLAHQRQFEAGQALSNATTLFGVTRIPSDNHIRDMLDPASPALLHPVFAAAVDQIRQIEGGLGHFRRLDGRLLIALDGTEYHCSRKIHCRHCSARLGGKGEVEYYHSMLAATLVAPGHDKVIPLEPEFTVPQVSMAARNSPELSGRNSPLHSDLITTKTPRRCDMGDGIEVEIYDLLKRLGGGAVAQAFGQAIGPGGILGL